MQTVLRNNDHVNADDIVILPLIDMNPSDYSCLFSVIEFVAREVERMKLPGTTLRFDQPLFVKVVEIALAKQIDTEVIRLAGFQTLMGAVGSAFHLMKGSGIEEALGQVYGSNSTIHIICGKAISRAIRAIPLLDAVLTSKLLERLLPEQKMVGASTSPDQLTLDRLSVTEAEGIRDLLTEVRLGIPCRMFLNL